jgi:hypothetical protein
MIQSCLHLYSLHLHIQFKASEYVLHHYLSEFSPYLKTIMQLIQCNMTDDRVALIESDGNNVVTLSLQK